MHSNERIELIEVDSYIQPDNSAPRAHAIYVILSTVPSDEWQRMFEYVCSLKVATRRRLITIVNDRLRVVIRPTDHLETVFRQLQEAVATTNERLATHPASD